MFRLKLFLGLIIVYILFPANLYAQLIGLNGIVQDFKTGNRIENINIFDKNSGIGTISNSEGYFRLILKPGEIELIFSDNNIAPVVKEFVLITDTIIDVKVIMKSDLKELGSVFETIESPTLAANSGKHKEDQK